MERGDPGYVDRILRPMFSGELRIATIIVDSQGRIVYFGHNAEHLTGFGRAEMIGRDIQVLTTTSIPFETRRHLAAAPSERPEIHQLRRADGSMRAVHVYRHPIPQPGRPSSTLLMAVDTVENSEAEAGLGLLNAFFDQSAFGFVILDNKLRYVALNEALARINRRPIADHLGRHIREVIGSADLDVYESALEAVLRTGEPVSNLHLPGHPTTAPGEEQVWSVSWYRLVEADDRPMGLCGVIMDITSGEEAELDAARSRARLSLLGEVGSTQLSSLDFRESTERLGRLLTTDYCDLVTVDVVNALVTGQQPPEQPGPDTLVARLVAAARNPSPATDKLLEVDDPRPASATNAFAQVLVSHRARLIDDPALSRAPNLPPEAHRHLAANSLGLSSLIIAPLRARDTTLGVMTCIRFADRERFDTDDLVLLTEIAARTALTIDNSRLYRDERQAALTLQRSLLPPRLPENGEVTITYRYRPSHSHLRAGGDWFDAVELPGRCMAIVVGDVAGHGITSAAAMGQFRTAVVTLASIGLDPAALLTRLNELSFHFADTTATCLYLVYDPVQHLCAVASAGHPPPVVVPPDGAAEAREVAGGPLLGAIPGADYRSSILETPPGTRLVMYSDGVVESRHTRLDDGIASVVRLASMNRPVTELCDQVMATSPSTDDDRTVMVTEFHGINPRDIG
ncbi:MAG TPA: SpoIIE family protein phosphatase [Stackebrandtia sp.]|jgi:PAS domain S-box-containing protein|uniref:SpoIIE family protein phosphatase n=1 Tax=Stackebrandtia sp. TaxID=2023065 RepID=UPI002D28EACA|nr:SpoIIE family protein phosphatase [Stackebrandtia sp.]HZE41812.1 SpoIIE family protein phosphatase [Stackebrandtia sp.]